MPQPAQPRSVLFISHAAPEDNDFALWLSARLATAGYKVWVDVRKLMGGGDFWDEIERVLREDAVKQIVAFTPFSRKPGVKRELAIGAGVARRLNDDAFMIPIRVGEVPFDEAPPEFIRANILSGHPNWHDCLVPLLETLEQAGIPRASSPNSEMLKRLVEAREQGRRFAVARPETLMTNWFPITPAPSRVRFFGFEGTKEQAKAWMKDCSVALAPASYLRIVGSFADPAGFAEAGPFPLGATADYDIAFTEFVSGINLGPLASRSDASNLTSNLLRQHFERLASAKGLKPFEFANGDVGWFFPSGLIRDDRATFVAPDGRRRWRSLSGKFKTLRWHLCIVAKPRIWPELVYRVHANLVLTEDGITPLDGAKTQKRRRRLTRSWWNHVWRDRLLAALSFLADGGDTVTFVAGNETFGVQCLPLSFEVPVSYDESGPEPLEEEGQDGEINLDPRLDERGDDLEDDL